MHGNIYFTESIENWEMKEDMADYFNFEDGIIDEDKFINTLNLFNKKPDKFGYKFEVSDEDVDEFEEFFNEDG